MLNIRFTTYDEYENECMSGEFKGIVFSYPEAYTDNFERIFENSTLGEYELLKSKEYAKYLRLYDSKDENGVTIVDGYLVRELDDIYTITGLQYYIKYNLLAIYCNLHDIIFYCFEYCPDMRFLKFAIDSDLEYTICLDVVDDVHRVYDELCKVESMEISRLTIDGVGCDYFSSKDEMARLFNNRQIEDSFENINNEIVRVANKFLNSDDYFGYTYISNFYTTIQYGDFTWYAKVITRFSRFYENRVDEFITDFHELDKFRYRFISSLSISNGNWFNTSSIFDYSSKYPILLIYGQREYEVYTLLGELHPVKNPCINCVLSSFIDDYVNEGKYSEYYRYIIVSFDLSYGCVLSQFRRGNILTGADRYIFIDIDKNTVDIGAGYDIMVVNKFVHCITGGKDVSSRNDISYIDDLLDCF